ncbi:hypothetical protein HLB44_15785 [Aquincola sp. S2]|uniref:ADP ribosyltransferase domain-containing protein n=1 Tax=Pseudaquabacterium terrae TaxID=2732868 RepID=A0ABX2EIM9_9BURK|nr:hypothetical protein [Aquabacterium terrae]NRF68455.1 hypothetical protein [Aquabacterium terrae]
MESRAVMMKLSSASTANPTSPANEGVDAQADSRRASTSSRASTAAPLPPGGLKARLKDKQVRAEALGHCATELHAHKTASGYQHTNAKTGPARAIGKLKNLAAAAFQSKPDYQQREAARFLAHVVDGAIPGKVIRPDPVDSTYTQYQATINHHHVQVSLKNTDSGVHVLPPDYHADPPLVLATQNLQQKKNWTVRYGAETALSAQRQTAVLSRTDPKTAAQAFEHYLLTNLPQGSDILDSDVQKGVNLLIEQHPDAVMKSLRTNVLPNADGRGVLESLRVFCNGTGTTKVLNCEEIKALPLEDRDAALIMAYRVLYKPLNRMQRSHRPERDAVHDLVVRINDALKKLPRHEGEGFIMRRIDVPQRVIDEYVALVGKTYGEKMFLSCTTNEDVLKKYPGNVDFYIKSTNGRDLGPLSPHNEVLVPANSWQNIDKVELGRAPGGRRTAKVWMTEVPPPLFNSGAASSKSPQ